MRGKGVCNGSLGRCNGITPACAGKRLRTCGPCGCPEDHPRVCGEKSRVCPRSDPGTGSPPRMRGKAVSFLQLPGVDRITPAYAGKSLLCCPAPCPEQDHPRVCGEKHTNYSDGSGQQGSPPRMRGKVTLPLQDYSLAGITPAYAGKSFRFVHAAACARDHPRVCGEKFIGHMKHRGESGSPPRMRGKVTLPLQDYSLAGITPAYAGKRLV